MNLKEKADAVFSLYVRLRDCPDGHGRCISCGCSITPKTCDAGHFIPRTHLATRWDERNVNIQCYNCNRMKDGNLAGYTIGLVEKYGDGIVGELNALKHATCKLTKSDYEELIKKYRL